jgi:transposase
MAISVEEFMKKNPPKKSGKFQKLLKAFEEKDIKVEDIKKLLKAGYTQDTISKYLEENKVEINVGTLGNYLRTLREELGIKVKKPRAKKSK